MDNQFDFSTSSFQQKNQPVPYATAVLVLGIGSIVGCCFSWVGGILGVIALILAFKGRNAYRTNPMQYTDASLKNLNAGRVCAIIGLIIFGIFLVTWIVLKATGTYDEIIRKLEDPEYIRELMEQYKNR